MRFKVEKHFKRFFLNSYDTENHRHKTNNQKILEHNFKRNDKHHLLANRKQQSV